MRLMRIADAMNETAFSTKTVSRPKAAARTPPTLNPIAKLNDQVVDDKVLAVITSDSGTMFGMLSSG